MPFETPITVRKAIENIHRKKYLLPAIQREFVWKTDQIEKLFDSLMRRYPIGSFLFWAVERDNVNNYQFYEFIRNFHERDNRHNKKADVKGESEITAILDGQQRLTALYIGLKGSYAYKLPRRRCDDDSAFPKRKLYLNLLASAAADSGLEYDFQFLTEKESQKSDSSHFWYAVGDILDRHEEADVNEYLIEKGVLPVSTKKLTDQAKFAYRTLIRLRAVVHTDRPINYFLQEDESLDKVLDIFIRVNNGGTKLTYSDMLLSMATAQWKEKDARAIMTDFVDDINRVGNGFDANKDFVLKSCLVLGGFRKIAFKVDNFTKNNMRAIEKQWDEISNAIKASFVLVASFGYQRDTLTSYNALIPIAQYLHKIGSPGKFSESAQYQEDRKRIFKWLVRVLLKKTFGGNSDNVLGQIRDVIKMRSDDGFPFNDILKELKGSPKDITFDDELDNLLYLQYGGPYTHSVLARLYPSFDFRNKFHQDHIFPKRLFTRKRLEKSGIAASEIDFYMDNYNCLANLQLLEGILNLEKAGKDLKTWIEEQYPDEDDRRVYMERHYIPDVDLSLENFPEFIEERKKLLIAALKSLLG